MSNQTRLPYYLRSQVLYEIWIGLFNAHQQVLDIFLRHHTARKVKILEARLRELASRESNLLVVRFNATPLQRFQHHLDVAITPARRVADASSWSDVNDSDDEWEDIETEDQDANTRQTLRPGKIYGVPQELFDKIIENACEDVYLPETCIAAQWPVFHGGDCFADAGFPLGKSIVLRQINSELYDHYKELYWTENTWVIPKGCVSYTTEILHLIPDEIYLKIRKLWMCFSTADSILAGGFKHYYDSNNSLLDNLALYDDDYRAAVVDQHKAWFEKFSYICAMKLCKLTLDFRNAFSIDGDFLGLQTVADFFRLDHGLPADFTILAPTRQLAGQIRDVLRAKHATG